MIFSKRTWWNAPRKHGMAKINVTDRRNDTHGYGDVIVDEDQRGVNARELGLGRHSFLFRFGHREADGT